MSRLSSILLAASVFMISSARAQTTPMKLSLDGEWFFKADSQKTGVESKWFAEDADRSDWQAVQTPRFWEGYPGLANYDGWGWFTRKFTVQKTSQPLSIHFAGVDDDATVWVNGIEVGSHTGYSDPFVLDVSHALHSGENHIVVQVMDNGGGGGIYKPITLIETRNLDELLKGPYFGKQALKSVDWVKDAVIYEVYLRSFSKEGTFAGLEKRVVELKALGVTVLWLMPVHPVGMKHRKGSLGSPYSVQDFYGINPEFGTMADFKKLLNTVHKQGMKLIIDLVINHTAWDNKLVAEHPEWYTKDDKGNIVPPNPDWTDVADLNYDQPGLRRYMMEMMRWWVKDVGIDGFRCDVAELVPTDFWEDVRKQLNKVKPVMMLSEGTLPEQHMKAFDLTYSWNIYDVLDPLLKGKKPVTLIDDILKSESLQFPRGSLRMRFNTNHDKNAWDSPAVTKFGLDGLKLSAVLVNTLPGVPLLYTGEEVANDKRLDLFEKVDVDWTRSREMGELYGKLFRLRKENKALSRGEMLKLVSSSDQDVYAFCRIAGKDKIIVALNFSSEPRFVTVNVPLSKILPGRKKMTVKEFFTGEKMEVAEATKEQIVLALEPGEYRVFEIK